MIEWLRQVQDIGILPSGYRCRICAKRLPAPCCVVEQRTPAEQAIHLLIEALRHGH